MIRTIERILREVLDNGEGQSPEDDMMTRLTPYEYVWPLLTYGERLNLARKLVGAIRDIKDTKLFKIPTKSEAEEFVKSILPGNLADDRERVAYHAKALRRWLATADRFPKMGIDDKGKNVIVY